MPGCIIPDTVIAVDHWKVLQSPHVRFYFLSHLHADHTQGLSPSWSQNIYCSPVTRDLLLHKYKGIRPDLVYALDVNESHLLTLDGQETMTVTVIEANHCPGAVMFLFQGYFGNILYTGDFRYEPELFENSPLNKYRWNVDILYLDNTYSDPHCIFATRQQAKQQIIDIIQRHPQYNVVIGINNLGKEDLLVELALHFKTWIVVEAWRHVQLKLLDLPDVFTGLEDLGFISTTSSLHISKENVNLYNNTKPTIAILPTALYVGLDFEPYSNNDKVFVVPYSDHSSYAELMNFVEKIRPKKIIPVVKSDAKGPNNVNFSSRANMKCFDRFLNRTPIKKVIIPENILNLLKYRNIQAGPVIQEPRTVSNASKRRKPLFPQKMVQSKNQDRGVSFNSPPAKTSTSAEQKWDNMKQHEKSKLKDNSIDKGNSNSPDSSPPLQGFDMRKTSLDRQTSVSSTKAGETIKKTNILLSAAEFTPSETESESGKALDYSIKTVVTSLDKLPSVKSQDNDFNAVHKLPKTVHTVALKPGKKLSTKVNPETVSNTQVEKPAKKFTRGSKGIQSSSTSATNMSHMMKDLSVTSNSDGDEKSYSLSHFVLGSQSCSQMSTPQTQDMSEKHSSHSEGEEQSNQFGSGCLGNARSTTSPLMLRNFIFDTRSEGTVFEDEANEEEGEVREQANDNLLLRDFILESQTLASKTTPQKITQDTTAIQSPAMLQKEITQSSSDGVDSSFDESMDSLYQTVLSTPVVSNTRKPRNQPTSSTPRPGYSHVSKCETFHTPTGKIFKKNMDYAMVEDASLVDENENLSTKRSGKVRTPSCRSQLKRNDSHGDSYHLSSQTRDSIEGLMNISPTCAHNASTSSVESMGKKVTNLLDLVFSQNVISHGVAIGNSGLDPGNNEATPGNSGLSTSMSGATTGNIFVTQRSRDIPTVTSEESGHCTPSSTHSSVSDIFALTSSTDESSPHPENSKKSVYKDINGIPFTSNVSGLKEISTPFKIPTVPENKITHITASEEKSIAGNSPSCVGTAENVEELCTSVIESIALSGIAISPTQPDKTSQCDQNLIYRRISQEMSDAINDDHDYRNVTSNSAQKSSFATNDEEIEFSEMDFDNYSLTLVPKSEKDISEKCGMRNSEEGQKSNSSPSHSSDIHDDAYEEAHKTRENDNEIEFTELNFDGFESRPQSSLSISGESARKDSSERDCNVNKNVPEVREALNMSVSKQQLISVSEITTERYPTPDSVIVIGSMEDNILPGSRPSGTDIKEEKTFHNHSREIDDLISIASSNFLSSRQVKTEEEYGHHDVNSDVETESYSGAIIVITPLGQPEEKQGVANSKRRTHKDLEYAKLYAAAMQGQFSHPTNSGEIEETQSFIISNESNVEPTDTEEYSSVVSENYPAETSEAVLSIRNDDALPASSENALQDRNEELLPFRKPNALLVSNDDCVTLPVRNEDALPIRNADTLPVRNRDASPIRNEVAMPVRNRDALPVGNRDASPATTEEALPVGNRDASPLTNKDALPVRNRDALPVTNEDALPVGNGDASPVTNQVELLLGNRDASPVTNEDALLVGNKDASPVTNEDALPVGNRDASLIKNRDVLPKTNTDVLPDRNETNVVENSVYNIKSIGYPSSAATSLISLSVNTGDKNVTNPNCLVSIEKENFEKDTKSKVDKVAKITEQVSKFVKNISKVISATQNIHSGETKAPKSDNFTVKNCDKSSKNTNKKINQTDKLSKKTDDCKEDNQNGIEKGSMIIETNEKDSDKGSKSVKKIIIKNERKKSLKITDTMERDYDKPSNSIGEKTESFEVNISDTRYNIDQHCVKLSKLSEKDALSSAELEEDLTTKITATDNTDVAHERTHTAIVYMSLDESIRSLVIDESFESSSQGVETRSQDLDGLTQNCEEKVQDSEHDIVAKENVDAIQKERTDAQIKLTNEQETELSGEKTDNTKRNLSRIHQIQKKGASELSIHSDHHKSNDHQGQVCDKMFTQIKSKAGSASENKDTKQTHLDNTSLTILEVNEILAEKSDENLTNHATKDILSDQISETSSNLDVSFTDFSRSSGKKTKTKGKPTQHSLGIVKKKHSKLSDRGEFQNTSNVQDIVKLLASNESSTTLQDNLLKDSNGSSKPQNSSMKIRSEVRSVFKTKPDKEECSPSRKVTVNLKRLNVGKSPKTFTKNVRKISGMEILKQPVRSDQIIYKQAKVITESKVCTQPKKVISPTIVFSHPVVYTQAKIITESKVCPDLSRKTIDNVTSQITQMGVSDTSENIPKIEKVPARRISAHGKNTLLKPTALSNESDLKLKSQADTIDRQSVVKYGETKVEKQKILAKTSKISVPTDKTDSARKDKTKVKSKRTKKHKTETHFKDLHEPQQRTQSNDIINSDMLLSKEIDILCASVKMHEHTIQYNVKDACDQERHKEKMSHNPNVSNKKNFKEKQEEEENLFQSNKELVPAQENRQIVSTETSQIIVEPQQQLQEKRKGISVPAQENKQIVSTETSQIIVEPPQQLQEKRKGISVPAQEYRQKVSTETSQIIVEPPQQLQEKRKGISVQTLSLEEINASKTANSQTKKNEEIHNSLEKDMRLPDCVTRGNEIVLIRSLDNLSNDQSMQYEIVSDQLNQSFQIPFNAISNRELDDNSNHSLSVLPDLPNLTINTDEVVIKEEPGVTTHELKCSSNPPDSILKNQCKEISNKTQQNNDKEIVQSLANETVKSKKSKKKVRDKNEHNEMPTSPYNTRKSKSSKELSNRNQPTVSASFSSRSLNTGEQMVQAIHSIIAINDELIKEIGNRDASSNRRSTSRDALGSKFGGSFPTRECSPHRKSGQSVKATKSCKKLELSQTVSVKTSHTESLQSTLKSKIGDQVLPEPQRSDLLFSNLRPFLGTSEFEGNISKQNNVEENLVPSEKPKTLKHESNDKVASSVTSEPEGNADSSSSAIIQMEPETTNAILSTKIKDNNTNVNSKEIVLVSNLNSTARDENVDIGHDDTVTSNRNKANQSKLKPNEDIEHDDTAVAAEQLDSLPMNAEVVFSQKEKSNDAVTSNKNKADQSKQKANEDIAYDATTVASEQLDILRVNGEVLFSQKENSGPHISEKLSESSDARSDAYTQALQTVTSETNSKIAGEISLVITESQKKNVELSSNKSNKTLDGSVNPSFSLISSPDQNESIPSTSKKLSTEATDSGLEKECVRTINAQSEQKTTNEHSTILSTRKEGTSSNLESKEVDVPVNDFSNTSDEENKNSGQNVTATVHSLNSKSPRIKKDQIEIISTATEERLVWQLKNDQSKEKVNKQIEHCETAVDITVASEHEGSMSAIDELTLIQNEVSGPHIAKSLSKSPGEISDTYTDALTNVISEIISYPGEICSVISEGPKAIESFSSNSDKTFCESVVPRYSLRTSSPQRNLPFTSDKFTKQTNAEKEYVKTTSTQIEQEKTKEHLTILSTRKERTSSNSESTEIDENLDNTCVKKDNGEINISASPRIKKDQLEVNSTAANEKPVQQMKNDHSKEKANKHIEHCETAVDTGVASEKEGSLSVIGEVTLMQREESLPHTSEALSESFCLRNSSPKKKAIQLTSDKLTKRTTDSSADDESVRSTGSQIEKETATTHSTTRKKGATSNLKSREFEVIVNDCDNTGVKENMDKEDNVTTTDHFLRSKSPKRSKGKYENNSSAKEKCQVQQLKADQSKDIENRYHLDTAFGRSIGSKQINSLPVIGEITFIQNEKSGPRISEAIFDGFGRNSETCTDAMKSVSSEIISIPEENYSACMESPKKIESITRNSEKTFSESLVPRFPLRKSSPKRKLILFTSNDLTKRISDCKTEKESPGNTSTLIEPVKSKKHKTRKEEKSTNSKGKEIDVLEDNLKNTSVKENRDIKEKVTATVTRFSLGNASPKKKAIPLTSDNLVKETTDSQLEKESQTVSMKKPTPKESIDINQGNRNASELSNHTPKRMAPENSPVLGLRRSTPNRKTATLNNIQVSETTVSNSDDAWLVNSTASPLRHSMPKGETNGLSIPQSKVLSNSAKDTAEPSTQILVKVSASNVKDCHITVQQNIEDKTTNTYEISSTESFVVDSRNVISPKSKEQCQRLKKTRIHAIHKSETSKEKDRRNLRSQRSANLKGVADIMEVKVEPMNQSNESSPTRYNTRGSYFKECYIATTTQKKGSAHSSSKKEINKSWVKTQSIERVKKNLATNFTSNENNTSIEMSCGTIDPEIQVKSEPDIEVSPSRYQTRVRKPISYKNLHLGQSQSVVSAKPPKTINKIKNRNRTHINDSIMTVSPQPVTKEVASVVSSKLTNKDTDAKKRKLCDVTEKLSEKGLKTSGINQNSSPSKYNSRMSRHQIILEDEATPSKRRKLETSNVEAASRKTKLSKGGRAHSGTKSTTGIISNKGKISQDKKNETSVLSVLNDDNSELLNVEDHAIKTEELEFEPAVKKVGKRKVLKKVPVNKVVELHKICPEEISKNKAKIPEVQVPNKTVLIQPVANDIGQLQENSNKSTDISAAIALPQISEKGQSAKDTASNLKEDINQNKKSVQVDQNDKQNSAQTRKKTSNPEKEISVNQLNDDNITPSLQSDISSLIEGTETTLPTISAAALEIVVKTEDDGNKKNSNNYTTSKTNRIDLEKETNIQPDIVSFPNNDITGKNNAIGEKCTCIIMRKTRSKKGRFSKCTCSCSSSKRKGNNSPETSITVVTHHSRSKRKRHSFDEPGLTTDSSPNSKIDKQNTSNPPKIRKTEGKSMKSTVEKANEKMLEIVNTSVVDICENASLESKEVANIKEHNQVVQRKRNNEADLSKRSINKDKDEITSPILAMLSKKMNILSDDERTTTSKSQSVSESTTESTTEDEVVKDFGNRSDLIDKESRNTPSNKDSDIRENEVSIVVKECGKTSGLIEKEKRNTPLNKEKEIRENFVSEVLNEGCNRSGFIEKESRNISLNKDNEIRENEVSDVCAIKKPKKKENNTKRTDETNTKGKELIVVSDTIKYAENLRNTCIKEETKNLKIINSEVITQLTDMILVQDDVINEPCKQLEDPHEIKELITINMKEQRENTIEVLRDEHNLSILETTGHTTETDECNSPVLNVRSPKHFSVRPLPRPQISVKREIQNGNDVIIPKRNLVVKIELLSHSDYSSFLQEKSLCMKSDHRLKQYSNSKPGFSVKAKRRRIKVIKDSSESESDGKNIQLIDLDDKKTKLTKNNSPASELRSDVDKGSVKQLSLNKPKDNSQNSNFHQNDNCYQKECKVVNAASTSIQETAPHDASQECLLNNDIKENYSQSQHKDKSLPENSVVQKKTAQPTVSHHSVLVLKQNQEKASDVPGTSGVFVQKIKKSSVSKEVCEIYSINSNETEINLQCNDCGSKIQKCKCDLRKKISDISDLLKAPSDKSDVSSPELDISDLEERTSLKTMSQNKRIAVELHNKRHNFLHTISLGSNKTTNEPLESPEEVITKPTFKPPQQLPDESCSEDEYCTDDNESVVVKLQRRKELIAASVQQNIELSANEIESNTAAPGQDSLDSVNTNCCPAIEVILYEEIFRYRAAKRNSHIYDRRPKRLDSRLLRVTPLNRHRPPCRFSVKKIK